MRRLLTGRIGFFTGMVAGFFVLAAGAMGDDAPKLRYGFQADHKYGYDIKITATIQSMEETREGVLIFEVSSATDDQFAVKVNGLLGSKVKGGSRRFPTFPRMPPMHAFGPFGVHRPNEWTLTRRGDVVIVGPIEQIPYLLGPKELLIYETLPADAKTAWENSGGIGVVEQSGATRHPFGPPTGTSEVGHGAGERADFAVIATTPEIVRLSKKYHLATTAVENGGTQFTMSGKGELEFDRKEGVFKSCAMKYDIEINDKNLKLTVPVTLDYHLLTDEELAAYQKKRKEEADAQAEAKKPKPVDAAERESLLKDLRSQDNKRIDAALERLAKAIVDDQPAQVSAAILPFLKQADAWRQARAAKAMIVWAAPNAEAALIALSKTENWMVRAPAVEALGRFKSAAAAEAAAAQLPRNRGEAGRALRAMGPVAEKAVWPWVKDRDIWVRAESRKILGEIGGKASIAYLKKEAAALEGHEQREVKEAISAIEVRLASGGGEAENTEAAAAESRPGESRTWRSASGLFKVDAVAIGCADDKVALKKADGTTVHVPIDKLSEEDQAWLKEHPPADAANPFE